jgi:hypothetical protein
MMRHRGLVNLRLFECPDRTLAEMRMELAEIGKGRGKNLRDEWCHCLHRAMALADAHDRSG